METAIDPNIEVSSTLEVPSVVFRNAYEDETMAAAYARLEFPGTYYLAYRDLPQIIAKHVPSKGRALDFGCGAGRSTRFLRTCGFDTLGVDISASMLQRARVLDPGGEYLLLEDDGLRALAGRRFDLILSAFTFDNVPTLTRKVALFRALGQLLNPAGRVINLVSSAAIYVNEWASFTTADFPENRAAQTGDIVRIINTAIDDRRPVEDILWPDDAYDDVFARANLSPVETYRPLGLEHEPFPWVAETRVAPWVIHVLRGSTT